jgi:hypothetical protein
MKLDPEVKWRTMVAFFLSYVSKVHEVLKGKVDEKNHREIIEQIAANFWSEQAQVFSNIFAINPGNARQVSLVKQILSEILDIKSKTIEENDDEVIIESEYRFCPVRITLRPILGEYCQYCELMGQILVQKIDPSFTHKVVIEGDVCRHIFVRKPATTG